MNLAPYSYTGPSGVATILDGTAGSHFVASIVNTPIQPPASINWTPTNSGRDPFPSGKQIRGTVIELLIKTTGATIGDDLDELAYVFDVHDTTLRRFICKDTDDSSQQWYIECTLYEAPKNTGRGVTVRLACKSAYWLTVNTTTESTWSITASGQSQAFTASKGNVDQAPVFLITPTSVKGITGSGGKYRRFITIYNRTQKVAHAYPIDVTGGGLNTSALIQQTAVSNQINNGAGYNSAATTFAIDTSVGGGLATTGGMWYCQRTGEQGKYTAIGGGSMTGITRGIGGTTAAALVDNDVLVNSKMLANGDDLRIFIGQGNGKKVEVPRWFGDSGTAVINNTATKIWISSYFAIRAQGTLSAAMTAGSTSFVLTSPEGPIKVKNALALIDSEFIAVTTYTPSTSTASSLTRGVMGSSAASHSAGATVVFLSQAWMFYGDPNADTPSYPIARKPCFNLASSTNSSWVYTTFSAENQQDATTFTPIAGGRDTILYTVDQDLLNAAPVVPNPDLGISLVNRLSFGIWQLPVPFGYTAAAFTGVDKYNLAANQAFFRDSASGNSLAVTANSSKNTWQTASQTFTPSTTRFMLQLYLKNTNVTNYPTRAAVNIGGLTITMDTSTTQAGRGVPAVSLGSEQTTTYFLNVVLSIAETGESIQIVHNMDTSQTLEVDTLNKTITYLADNSDCFSSLRPFPARNEWLRFVPGTNTVTWTEVGATGVDVVVKHQGRNNTPA